MALIRENPRPCHLPKNHIPLKNLKIKGNFKFNSNIKNHAPNIIKPILIITKFISLIPKFKITTFWFKNINHNKPAPIITIIEAIHIIGKFISKFQTSL